MTAPRTFLDDPRLAKLLGLAPELPEMSPTHPNPLDIPGTEAEMAAWQKRGGKIDPSSDLAGFGVKLPGGLYGGEFSDPEQAAFTDASGKLDAAKRSARLAPILAALRAKATQHPDATRRGK